MLRCQPLRHGFWYEMGDFHLLIEHRRHNSEAFGRTLCGVYQSTPRRSGGVLPSQDFHDKITDRCSRQRWPFLVELRLTRIKVFEHHQPCTGPTACLLRHTAISFNSAEAY